jgi:galactose-1-phosphate uridylyltransferase
MGQKPTRFVDTLIKNAHRYGEEEGRDLWVDYLAWEKGEERYIGSSQGWEWLVSFAPRGMAGEIAFFFPERHSLFTLNDDIINGLCAGLCRVLSYLNGINLISFNLALYGTMGEDRRLPLQGRLIPRYLIPPLGASDVNYFEKCHGEIICPFVPEDLARGLKEAFFNLSTEGD